MASTGSLKKMVYLHQQQYNEITVKDENTVYITQTDNYGGVIGATGATFLPVVDANGNLGWSNNGGLPNPTTRNIKGANDVNCINGAVATLFLCKRKCVEMNEWAIVSVLLTLATLIGFFVKVTSTYERTTTKLTVAVENLQKCMEDMKISKEKTHERIFGLLDNQDEVLGNHENRIQKLEDKK